LQVPTYAKVYSSFDSPKGAFMKNKVLIAMTALMVLGVVVTSCQTTKPPETQSSPDTIAIPDAPTLSKTATWCDGVATPKFDQANLTRNSLNGAKVVIDPGHGRQKTVSSTWDFERKWLLFTEDINNIDVAKVVAGELTSNGVITIPTRDIYRTAGFGPESKPMAEYGSKVYLEKTRLLQPFMWDSEGNDYTEGSFDKCTFGKDLRSRPYLANAEMADAFISLHSNANQKGFRVFVSIPDGVNGNNESTSMATYSESWMLARKITQAARSALASSGIEVHNPEVHPEGSAVLRFSRVPSVLIEIASHVHEPISVTDYTYQRSVAQAVREGFRDFLTSRESLRFVSRRTNQCLGVEGNSDADLTRIIDQPCNNSVQQQFRKVYSYENSSQFYLVSPTKKCLHLTSWSTGENAPIYQFQCGLVNRQLFTSGSGGTLINVNSGKCLIPETTGGRIIQVTCNGNTNQQFTLNPTVTPPPTPSAITGVQIAINGTNIVLNTRQYPSMTYSWIYSRVPNDPEQTYDFLPPNSQGGNAGWMIRRQGTNACLNAFQPKNLSDLILYSCTPSDPDQQWDVVNTETPTVKMIRNRGRNFCLNAPYRTNNSKMTMYSCIAGDADQRYRLIYANGIDAPFN
jgi:N-acetylmuramoyl-L-alanine amidase